MNVVGKVGSLLTQSVYSVATPFHPFGGAVDVIVVQQQDGSFRSTPWHVRFGKFQGVLKGAEKVVRIEVNGVEADFHMYLDNSGEAYFIREAESNTNSEGDGSSNDFNGPAYRRENIDADHNRDENTDNENDRQDKINSSKDELLVEDGCKPSILDELETTGSDSDRTFYEFQDNQSSLDGSVSDYGSSRYENLDDVQHIIQSQDSNSEMVLMSVDGHVLTAPISSFDKNSDHVQLTIPQFHLGPGGETDFIEDSEEFSTTEATWTAGYPRDSEASTSYTSPEKISTKNDVKISERQVGVGEGDAEHTCQAQKVLCTSGEQMMASITSDSVDACVSPEKDDAQVEGQNIELTNGKELTCAESEIYSSMSSSVLQDVNGCDNKTEVHLNDGNCESISSHSVSKSLEQEEQIGVSLTVRKLESSSDGFVPEVESCKIDAVESQVTSFSKDTKTKMDRRFELSLCKNFLCSGMGLSAAAEMFDSHIISAEQFSASAASIVKNENLVVRIQEKYLSWDIAAPIVLGMAAYELCLPIENGDIIPVEQNEIKTKEDDSVIASIPSGRRRWLFSNPFRRVKTLEHTNSSSSNEEVFLDSESDLQNPILDSFPTPGSSSLPSQKHFIRTNLPTTEQIASLNLKEGQNMLSFIFSTRVLGIQKVDAHIYLWKWNARIVISDVDGTITKSDVLGQFMPLVGKDWTQSGVARLFSAIKENGYQLMFLSARAIVQAYLTRNFLLNLKQDGKALPNGPVVISPDGLFPSLFREVIRRAPHEFKIACLEDIKALFPADYNPFYAGFGNRDTDELTYRKMGIPKGKIFIINPKGEVAISHHRIDRKSYTSLHTLVNDMFPPTSLVEQEDYNAWNFWRMPMPDIDDL